MSLALFKGLNEHRRITDVNDCIVPCVHCTRSFLEGVKPLLKGVEQSPYYNV